MKHWTVKRRTIVAFSAVAVIMIVLSLLAYARLAAIEIQATDLRRDYVPSLYLADGIHAASILVSLPRVESVNERMQAQTTGAEQISEALMQLSGAAQQTVVSLRRSSEAMDDLHQVANGLAGDVSHVTRQAA